MRYLVLGSSGQVGAALTRYLQTLNHEVLTFDLVANAEVMHKSAFPANFFTFWMIFFALCSKSPTT